MVFADLVTLFIFLAVLAESSQMVVKSSMKISEFLGLSHVAVGFLLVSTATSLPELSVSIVSSTAGEGAISLGNVFGSNIADILIVLGIAALLYGVKVKRREFETISPILIVCSIVAFALLFSSVVEKWMGVMLLVLFLAYAYYLIKKRVTLQNDNHVSRREAAHAFLVFCVAIIVVLYSSSFIVESASMLAVKSGIAKGFIGATIVAVGTSLPEFAVDLQAVRKKKYGLAVGDAIGSVMTNTTLVLGSAATINSIIFDVNIARVFLVFSIVACMALFCMLKTSEWVREKKGVVLLLLYVVYLLALIVTQISILK